MADRVVKVTKQSWGQRLKGSFSGILVGLLLVAIGIGLLFWNEGRAVRRATSDNGCAIGVCRSGCERDTFQVKFRALHWRDQNVLAARGGVLFIRQTQTDDN